MIGEDGSMLVTDTTSILGCFKAIQVLNDATFTTLSCMDVTKNGNTTATGADFGTLATGTVLYGKFTAVTLATGKVILYK